MHANTVFQRALALIALSTSLLLAGCGYGPEETVTVEISGVADDAQREEIQETLKTMTEGSGHSMSTSSSGDTMTVELAPVTDVEAFADGIDFGRVKSVEGRTVEVVVGEGDDENAEDGDGGPNGGGAATLRGFDTPRAAFNGLKKAIDSNDGQAIAAVLTAESQETFAAILVFTAGFAALDEQKRPEIESILKRHGIDTESDEGGAGQGIKSLAEPIKDKPAFIGEMLSWLDENADQAAAAPQPVQGELQEVQVQGDTAKGVVVTKTGQAERSQPIEFRKTGGRWLVHLPEPQMGGAAPPSGFEAPSGGSPNGGTGFATPPGTGGASAGATASSAAASSAADIPAEPVSGTLFGRQFEPDRFEFSSGDILTIRQGKDFFADAEIKLFLLLDEGESPAGKSWNVSASGKRFGVPHVHAAVKKPDGNGRRTEIYTGGDYTLALAFSQPKDDQLTGRIHLVLPDDSKSEIAGTFQVEMPEDRSQPPGERHKPFIHGQIDFEPSKEDWLRAGYTGLTVEGQRQSNMAGTKLGPENDGGWVESTTFKPRISRVDASQDGPPKYRHVRVEPGTYLVYVKWGDEYLAGRWTEVDEDSGLVLNFQLNPNETGTLEVSVPADSKQKMVRLLPLNAKGGLPAGLPEQQARHLAFSLDLSAEAADGKARLAAARPGPYRVFFDRDTRDVTIKAGQTARLEF